MCQSRRIHGDSPVSSEPPINPQGVRTDSLDVNVDAGGCARRQNYLPGTRTRHVATWKPIELLLRDYFIAYALHHTKLHPSVTILHQQPKVCFPTACSYRHSCWPARLSAKVCTRTRCERHCHLSHLCYPHTLVQPCRSGHQLQAVSSATQYPMASDEFIQDRAIRLQLMAPPPPIDDAEDIIIYDNNTTQP